MGSIDEKSIELEVKHKVNGSWHPCRVSLSTGNSKFGIIINFANSNEQDIISNREDAITRLRFRSTTLQDGECSHIKEGDCVLAMYKDQFKSMFFDAVIEKPNRVKHSNRVFCRCTFEIKWIHPELKEETMTIPSKSIMKLSRTEIVSHPIVAAFLNNLSPTDGAETSSFLSLLEETNYEADVEWILEKQIEEISKLVDGSMDCSADLLEVKRASLGGRKQSKEAVSSNDKQSNLRRSTRSQNKEQVEVELKKVLEDDKPFLSPLAACAALASRIHEHELPMKRELSFSLVGQECQEDLAQKDSEKQIKMHSSDINYKYMRCGGSSKENTLDLLNLVPYGDNDRHQCGAKDKTTVNNLIGSTNVSRLSGRSTTTRVTRSSVNREGEVLSDEGKCRSSKKMLTSPVNSTRKTHSSMHKEIDATSDEVKKDYSIENTRLTRTRNQKKQSNTHGIPEESEGNLGSSSTIVNNSIDMTSAQSMVKSVTRSSVHKEIKASSDVMKPTMTRATRSTMHKEIEDSSDAVKLTMTSVTRSSVHKEIEASSDAVKPTMPRVTRSSVHKEIEASSDAVKQESSNSKVISSNARSACSQNQMIDMIQDTIDISEDVTPGRSKSKKRSLDSHVDPNKRIRASHDVTVTTEESGAILEDNENASSEKKKSERMKVLASKKPVLRSSPRFNFLPITHSQK